MNAPILNLCRENEVLVSFWFNEELHEIPMSSIPGISCCLEDCANAAITVLDHYCFCFVTVVGEGQGGVLLVYDCNNRNVVDTIDAEYAKSGYVLRNDNAYYIFLSHGIRNFVSSHLGASIISFDPKSGSLEEVLFEKQEWKYTASELIIFFDSENGIFTITNEGDDEKIEFPTIGKKLAEIEAGSSITDGRRFFGFQRVDENSYQSDDSIEKSNISCVENLQPPYSISFITIEKNKIVVPWEYDYQNHQQSFDNRAKAINSACHFVSPESYDMVVYQVKRVIDLLTKYGFIKYYIYEEKVGLAIIDTSYRKYPVLVEKINIILSLNQDELRKELYYLLDRDGKLIVSQVPGSLGGHYRLKIYGRMDCPSAMRYIKKGQYIQHRVFFRDEEVAIAAGYRPCGVCMPDAYKKWKEAQIK